MMKYTLGIVAALLFSAIVSAQVTNGQTVPELSLPSMTGDTIKLSNIKGKIILIDFWASWCAPCRRNNPFLVYLYKKYKSKGLEIYGLSIDDEKERWLKAVRKDKLLWPQVMDNKGWDSPSALSYGVDAIPANFLLDKNRILIARNLEGLDLEKKIKELLK